MQHIALQHASMHHTALQHAALHRATLSPPRLLRSFGVLMWEIFSFGENPYPGIANDQVHRKLTQGVRLERPSDCSTDAYKVMHTCWKMDPDVSEQASNPAQKLCSVTLPLIPRIRKVIDRWYAL